jgi:hypothetical protein
VVSSEWRNGRGTLDNVQEVGRMALDKRATQKVEVLRKPCDWWRRAKRLSKKQSLAGGSFLQADGECGQYIKICSVDG